MLLHRRTLLLSSSAEVGVLSLGAFGIWAKAPASAPEPIPYDGSFPKLPIGMNLSGIADWEPGFPFKNLFLGARPWLTRNLSGRGPWDTKSQENFDYDDDGYPLEVPISAGLDELQTIFTTVPRVRTPGRYILLHDGEGEIDGLLGTKVLKRSPGRLLLQMTHDPGGRAEAIVIKRSKRGNHIRNIRLLSEEHAEDDLARDPFLPEFLNFCRPFRCLRFMDWGGTNNSLQETWTDRKRPTFYTMVSQGGDPQGRWGPPPTPFVRKFAGGVAYEYMIQLCNTLKIDMWICIPHRATDDYIAQFARLVRLNLDPALKVYVEFSNEIWNWQFHQAGWMLQSPLAGTLVESKGGFPWKNSDRTDGKDHPERIGALFRRAFSIWEREWSEDRHRMIRVCSVQVGWPDTAKRTIRWCMDHGGADVVSPTAYFGPSKEHYRKWAAAGGDLTADMVIDDMFEMLREQREGSKLSEVVAFGRSLGLPYVAYEGGQHIQPEKQAELPYNPALAEAQMHPRMADLYLELIRIHRDLGCQMLTHFSSVSAQGTRWGSWGAKASYAQPDEDSPKMRTLLACNIVRT
jgi:hypothetical protein